ncbi:Uncharacterised protein [Actinobacillus pleuropneumoniae]|nr:Uncharacterised protein [Actinobacillus pleuropneumoniae]
MTDLVNKYDPLDDIKLEVSKFTSMLQSKRALPNHNELAAIAKYIIAMKVIINYHGGSHYKNCMIYDILSCVNSLTSSSIRNFHYVYRSFIENYLRSMLNLNDSDETGVNQLFRSMEEKYAKTIEGKAKLDFIAGEYSKSCLYVHSNAKAKATVQLYLADITSNDDFNRIKLSATINKVLQTLKKMFELFIISHPDIIENSFYRNKQKLRYLIGEGMYLLMIRHRSH